MHTAKLSSVLLLVLGLANARTAFASELAEGEVPEPETRDYLCAPRLQLRHPQRCPRLGPGARVTELARLGLLPPKPLPTAEIDPALSYIPFDYLRTNSGRTPLYTSFEDALAGGGGASWITSGFVYLSYSNREEGGGTAVYSTPSGYVRSDSVNRVKIPRSPGLTFEKTPDRPFAWINAGGVCTSEEPGGPLGDHTRCFTRNSVVQIYGKERFGDWDWYMIGPNQWLEQRLLAIVEPDPAPPEGMEDDRWVSVNLFEQTLAAYDEGVLKFATVVSSGRKGFWTQPGLFQVWAKLERDDMTGGFPDSDDGNFYLLEDVPWVLYFDQARALHGTYWHSKFGTPTSRGCVNLAPRDANWIFNFADEGTWVHVIDPSGITPTDPAFYGPGGA